MRELKTADQIQAEIEYLVNANREVREDQERRIHISAPTPLRDPDGNGCNWTIDTYRGSPTYLGLVELTVAAVQLRWNLR